MAPKPLVASKMGMKSVKLSGSRMGIKSMKRRGSSKIVLKSTEPHGTSAMGLKFKSKRGVKEVFLSVDSRETFEVHGVTYSMPPFPRYLHFLTHIRYLNSLRCLPSFTHTVVSTNRAEKIVDVGKNNPVFVIGAGDVMGVAGLTAIVQGTYDEPRKVAKTIAKNLLGFNCAMLVAGYSHKYGKTELIEVDDKAHYECIHKFCIISGPLRARTCVYKNYSSNMSAVHAADLARRYICEGAAHDYCTGGTARVKYVGLNPNNLEHDGEYEIAEWCRKYNLRLAKQPGFIGNSA